MIPLRLALAPSRNVVIFNLKLKRALAASAAMGLLTLSHTLKAQAAPPARALSFKVFSRISYKVPGESPLPPQIVEAKMLVRGDQARIETKMGGQPSIILFSPPYLYRLLPASHAGVRFKAPAKQSPSSGASNFQMMLRDPSKIRGTLKERGAVKVGEEKLAGVPVEKYQIKNFRGEKGQIVSLWVRKADALPARMEISGSNLQMSATWSEYAHPRNVSDAQFAPPPGYKIRESQSQAPFPQL